MRLPVPNGWWQDDGISLRNNVESHGSIRDIPVYQLVLANGMTAHLQSYE